MTTSQCGVVEDLERDLTECDMHPDVVAAALKRVSQGIARGLRVTGSPEFDPLGVIELHLVNTTRMNKLELVPTDTTELPGRPVLWGAQAIDLPVGSTGRLRHLPPSSPRHVVDHAE